MIAKSSRNLVHFGWRFRFCFFFRLSTAESNVATTTKWYSEGHCNTHNAPLTRSVKSENKTLDASRFVTRVVNKRPKSSGMDHRVSLVKRIRRVAG